MKFIPSGTALAKFSLATNERFKDKSGEWQDRTEWHNVVAWQKLAEIVGEYLQKGSKVYVEGKLQTSSWEDRQSGQTKYRTEVVARELLMLGGTKESSEGTAGRVNFDQRREEDSEDEGQTITDEDIPF